MKLSDVAINRPVLTTMATVAVLVLGGLAIFRLGLDLLPDVSFPVVTIVTPYPGADPGEVEWQVTRPIEEAVSTINGVDEIRSYSRESMSTIVVMFKMDADSRLANSDVRDRIAMIRGELPRDVRDPVLTRVDPTAIPVLTYAVTSSGGPLATRRLTEDVIRPALERVEGVGSVAIAGGAVREIRVELDRDRLEAFHLTVADVAQAVGAESFDLPSGRMSTETRETGLKAAGRFQSPGEVGHVVLTSTPNGAQIRVRDVAQVVDGLKDVRMRTRVDGTDAVTFEVLKRGGTNTVTVADGIEVAIARLAGRLPQGASVTKVVDGSQFIRNNVHELWRALIIGGAFAIAVIFLFMLDWRSTAIAALALPTSVIASFFVMWQLRFTINMMTMMGLSLAIGLLIDDSVVVRENIFRHMERGEDRVTAARRGTDEIAQAVIATTFTIVAVFLPVAFMGGLVGTMFRQFGLTVSVAVLVSLVVSFTLDPMLSARITQAIAADRHERMRRHRMYGPLVRAYDALDAAYGRTLAWSLEHRKTVVGTAIALFVASLLLVPLMGAEFAPRSDLGDFTVNLELPPSTPLDATDAVTREVEQALRREPEVVTVATTVGPNGEVNKAAIYVTLTPKTRRRRSLGDIMEAVRPTLASIPALTFTMREAAVAGAAESVAMQAPITLYVQGSDRIELLRVARDAEDLLRRSPGVRDVAVSSRAGAAEQHLVIDRTRAGDLGVSFAAVAAALRTAVEGERVAKYQEGDQDIDVRVQLRAPDRSSLQALQSLTVPARRGAPVTVAEVTRPSDAVTSATVERLNRERQVTISANIVGTTLGEAVSTLEPQLNAIPRPAGTHFFFAGEADRMREAFSALMLALALAVVFIYLVLASQFESFVHPFTIMLSLPLALVGALAALFLTKRPLDLFSMIGIVLLMGLVTKNAILLVDYTNQVRKRGKDIIAALLEAGQTRLRPILMTSAAMILGMLPTAVLRGEGSEMRAPTAIAVIGGVLTSTLLTLVVVPVVYVWIDRLAWERSSGRRP